MKMENIKSRLISLCRRIGKRNFVIAGAFMLVAVALVIGIAMSSAQDNGFDYSQGVGMQPSDTSGGDQSAADTYFSSVQVDRQRSRDEALEVLQSVVDDDSATATAKEEALAEINRMARTMEAESNIETLIVAKGFSECVAVISEGGASIVVRTDGLQAAQISQINEIVYEQSGILPVNVKIIERK